MVAYSDVSETANALTNPSSESISNLEKKGKARLEVRRREKIISTLIKNKIKRKY